MVWKMFFEEFHDGCLMLSPLRHLNGMLWAFCVTYLPAASNLGSAKEDIWFGR